MAMGKKLNNTLRGFIERQPMFFVATAAPDGRPPEGACTHDADVLPSRATRWSCVSMARQGPCTRATRIGMRCQTFSRRWPDRARSSTFPSTSCGTGVPFMDFVAQRGERELVPYWEEKGEAYCQDYWGRRNATSIDGKATGIV